MKRILALMLVGLVMLVCGEKSGKMMAKEPSKQVKDYVEILYFHGKQRCVTCRAIEKNAKELLDSKFAGKMKAGKVVWRVIDISKKENEAIAEKYQVAWSSLYLVIHKNGKEQAENLTEFAFANAKSNPAKFKAELQQRINKALK